MRIVDLDFPSEEIVRQAAALLVDGFRENWPGSWPTLGDALEEVREADLPTRLASVRNLKQHPYEFYQRLGYTIVGVVPDANGIGKPDILMAKRIGA